MAYAAQADIEDRYPGELAQAGPREPDGDLDAAAIALALDAASATVDRTLRALGWATPVAAPIPDWLTALTVDLALYLATPTVLASQADFSDRRQRYLAALDVLAAAARGDILLPSEAAGAPSAVLVTAASRLFLPGAL